MVMQQDAAEGLGVSPNSLTLPHEWGTEGVEETSLAAGLRYTVSG